MLGEPDHPRIRGEHPSGRARICAAGGSSPHTRGARPARNSPLRVPRIIPAYAGSTKSTSTAPATLEDHPRIRGEHLPCPLALCATVGSSPHTRGAPAGARDDGPRCGIIPAYAGSTPTTPSTSAGVGDHPRIRGEHNLHILTKSKNGGSSPHTRGAPAARPTPRKPARIIPAYAGSTLGNPCNTKDRRRDYTSFPLPVTHPSGGGGS